MPRGRGRFQQIKTSRKRKLSPEREWRYPVNKLKCSESTSQPIVDQLVTDTNSRVHNSILIFAELPLLFPKFNCISSLPVQHLQRLGVADIAVQKANHSNPFAGILS